MPKTTSKNTVSDNVIVVDYSTLTYYPWQLSIWGKIFSSHFKNSLKPEQFPHAVLLAGVSGIGKKDLALYYAKSLLCQSPKKNEHTGQVEACHSNLGDECRSCQLFNSANHPDFVHITTPEEKKVIPVDSIRELIEWSVLSSQMGGKKVILIEPAEAMNPNASNSLLKTLEEPVPGTIIILLTNKKQALLPTIRSRCQTIDLPLPEKQYAKPWLQQKGCDNSELLLSLASGAPLLALDMTQVGQLHVRNSIINHLLTIINGNTDPVKVAEELFKQTKVKKTKVHKNMPKAKKDTKPMFISTYDIIYWTDSILSDLARLAQNCDQNTINNIDFIQSLQPLSHRLNLNNVLQLSDLINKAYFEIQGQVNINLLLEKLMIDWKNCLK
ncbi:MAG: DNA polymerase III subunit delta' [Gammaproteobacteria bacterium]|nr:DNA polymerase III subunit delta' [Gammaproteobacteria bacterium]